MEIPSMTNIPPRPQDALTGAQIRARIIQILGDTQTASASEMEQRRAAVEEFVYQQFISGNVPAFMRPENFHEVTVEMQRGGRTIRASVRACPDYLAIGSDSDFVRAPLDAITAQRIADRFGFVMPTPRLADEIDAAAAQAGGTVPFIAAPLIAKRVTDPHTGKPVEAKWNYKKYGFYEGRWMLSGEFLTTQNTMIQEQAASHATFRSGHKKVIVYDPLALRPSGEGGPPVVIYLKGVQPLSNIHNEGYWDYSHGIRFLDSSVRLTITEADGSRHEETRQMRDILMDRTRDRSASDLDKNLYRLFAPAPMDITLMYRQHTSRTQHQQPAQRQQPAHRQAVPRRVEIDVGPIQIQKPHKQQTY
jgi:hypothetical protein